jgi:hypothetical protein
MKQVNQRNLTPRMQEAVEELKRLITERFPEASFVVEEGFDPEGIYLIPTVDIDDTDEVIAVIGNRLVELQVDEGLGFPISSAKFFTVGLIQLMNVEFNRMIIKLNFANSLH